MPSLDYLLQPSITNDYMSSWHFMIAIKKFKINPIAVFVWGLLKRDPSLTQCKLSSMDSFVHRSQILPLGTWLHWPWHYPKIG